MIFPAARNAPRLVGAILVSFWVFLSAVGVVHAQTTVEPRSPNWVPSTLLTYDPTTDPDAPYNRSMVPLATTRFAPPTATQNAALNALLNVNAHAHPQEARVMALVAFDGAACQGTRSARFYAPTAWPYIDRLVYWGSSRSGNWNVSAPPAQVVDAAHRNGVTVMGNVYFGWNSSADNTTLQAIRSLLTKSGSTFPVADKMIQVASYFGFDGWFINQENYQTTSADAQNMLDFIAYYRAHAPAGQEIIWYDAMDTSGSRNYQNAFDSVDAPFMLAGSTLRAKTMFLNFWWYYNSTGLSSSRTYALSLGVDPYTVYAGLNTEGNGDNGLTPDPNNTSNLSIPWSYLFPEGSPHNLSLGIYRPEWTYNYSTASDPTSAIKREIQYWSGPNSDPANSTIPSGSSASNWPGIAYYVPANSVITTKPFFTHFNIGQGTQAAINGTISASGPWTNLSTQDLLPTWKWNVTVTPSSAAKLAPAFDYTDAYYGGTCLKITGALAAGATNDVKLYQTSLPVATGTNLQIIYKPTVTGASNLQVGLAFQDAPATFVYLAAGSATTTGWNAATLPLSAYAGRTIAAISLRFASASAVSSYSLKLGRLAIYDGTTTVPDAPSGVMVDAKNSVDFDTLSLRLHWTAPTSAVQRYNVYVRHTDNTLTWAGASLGTTYFLPAARRINSESAFTIEVEAVSPTYGASAHAVSVSVAVPATPSLNYPFVTSYNPVVGATVIGTATTGSLPASNAFDNSTTDYFEPADSSGTISNGAWAGLDLGAGNTRPVTAISYYPRANWATRMTGGSFQASNTANFSSGVVTLGTIDATPIGGQYTTFATNSTTAYRYVRYLSPDGGCGNVAEIKFYGTAILPTSPADLVASLSGTTASLSWTAQSAAVSYNIKRGTVNGGAYTTIATGVTAATYQDSGLSASATYYYIISAVNEAGESPASARLVVANTPATPLTGTYIGVSGGSVAEDGSTSTYYGGTDPDAQGIGWDLGSGNAKVLTSIRYCPRNSNLSATFNADKMIGGKFQGAKSADFSDAATLFTVTVSPPYNVYSYAAVSSATAYRYYRYLAPDLTRSYLSEGQYFGVSVPAAPTGVVVKMVDGTTTLQWSAATDAYKYNVKRGVSSTGPFTTVGTVLNGTIYQDAGLTRQSIYYYEISGVSEAGEGANSAVVVATDTYSQWIVQHGGTPGAAGMSFGEGLNAQNYAVPSGLGITASSASTTLSAQIFQDPALTVSLQSSVDLVNWTMIPLTAAPDQTGVPAGFMKMIAQDTINSTDLRKFYRLLLSR